MGRRTFSREYKLEAVRLVRERGVSVAQASRDLGVQNRCPHVFTQPRSIAVVERAHCVSAAHACNLYGAGRWHGRPQLSKPSHNLFEITSRLFLSPPTYASASRRARFN
jgi:hypothetical protein